MLVHVIGIQQRRFLELGQQVLGSRQVGDTVNIETDVLAKYVERQLGGTVG